MPGPHPKEDFSHRSPEKQLDNADKGFSPDVVSGLTQGALKQSEAQRLQKAHGEPTAIETRPGGAILTQYADGTKMWAEANNVTISEPTGDPTRPRLTFINAHSDKSNTKTVVEKDGTQCWEHSRPDGIVTRSTTKHPDGSYTDIALVGKERIKSQIDAQGHIRQQMSLKADGTETEIPSSKFHKLPKWTPEI